MTVMVGKTIWLQLMTSVTCNEELFHLVNVTIVMLTGQMETSAKTFYRALAENAASCCERLSVCLTGKMGPCGSQMASQHSPPVTHSSGSWPGQTGLRLSVTASET